MVREFLAVLVAVCAVQTVVPAASPLGPPVAQLEQRQFRAGFDYAYSEADVDYEGTVGGTATEGTFRDFESNAVLTNIGYGVSDSWEVYALLGMADGDIEEFDFDSDFEFSGGFGTKLSLHRQGDISWGGLFQMLWFQPEGEMTISGTVRNADVDAYLLQTAVGPCYHGDGFRLYGGPVFYYVDGKVEFDTGGGSDSVDFDEDPGVGAYGGAEIDLGDGCCLLVEYQGADDIEVIGASLQWRF